MGAGAVLVAGCPAGGVVAFFSAAGVTVFFAGVTGSDFLQPLNVNATNARTANAVRTTLLMVIPFRKTYSLELSANTPACQDP